MPWRLSNSSAGRRKVGEALAGFPSDSELVGRIAERDRRAFEVLYRRYYRRLFGLVARWLDQPEAVEEIIDDVLFTVWTDAGTFEGRSRVSTWVFGIAHHLAMHQLRRTRDDAPLDDAPEPWSEDTEVRRWELRSSLAKALDTLSAEHRAVVELTYFEGCSYREIAEILGCPVNTVKSRMFYARRQLRGLLPKYGWNVGTKVHGRL